MKLMKRGQIAVELGIGRDTLLVWEQAGLLSPGRNDAGHRMYGDLCFARCRFIQASQALGFTLEKIKRVLEYSETTHAKEFVRLEALTRLEEISVEIDQMKESRAVLLEIIKIFDGDPTCECEFMNYLFSHIKHEAHLNIVQGGKR